jgi:hypothetical protein
MDKQLKPCPFCGGEAIVVKVQKDIYAVGCTEENICPGYVWKLAPIYYGKACAIEYWNRRLDDGSTMQELHNTEDVRKNL